MLKIKDKRKQEWELYNKAIEMAMKFHVNQYDCEHQPYITHLFRVANACYPDVKAMTIAILHDILEDTPCTAYELQEVFGDEIASAVIWLSRKPLVSYEIYISNLKDNSILRKVKIADLKDNLNPTRIKYIYERYGHDANKWNEWYTKRVHSLKLLEDIENRLKEGTSRYI